MTIVRRSLRANAPAKLRGVNRVRLFAASIALLSGTLGQVDAQAAPGDTLAAPAPTVPMPMLPSPPTPKPPPAFSRVEAARFAGVAALGGLTYIGDHQVRTALRSRSGDDGTAVDGFARVVYYYGEPGVALLALGMWGTGQVASRPTLAVSGLRGMEAIAVSGLVTIVLKELTGRARPDVPPNAKDDWRFARAFGESNNDYQSMASGHATVAFAFATAVTQAVAERAPQHARVVGVSTFALATATSWERVRSDRHWASDVVVGAGVGTVTALAIARWHATRPDNVIDRVLLRPVVSPTADGGVHVGVTLRRR